MFFIPYDLVFTLLGWAACLFAPYVLWRLAQCRCYGWIVAFALFVVGPLAVSLVVQPKTPGDVTVYVTSVLPLFAFYGYLWLLRHSVDDWIEELHWKARDHRQRNAACAS